MGSNEASCAHVTVWHTHVTQDFGMSSPSPSLPGKRPRSHEGRPGLSPPGASVFPASETQESACSSRGPSDVVQASTS